MTLADAYGAPALEDADEEDADAETLLDVREAEAAVSPPVVRRRAEDEEIEAAVIAKAEAEQDRFLRRVKAGMSEGEFNRAVNKERQARQHRGDGGP